MQNGMTSVQERARKIELKESASHITSCTSSDPPGELNPPTLEGKSAAPLRRIMEWSDVRSSGISTSFPSHYRANGNILDFEGISLEEEPRPLLPPRPIASEVCETRRASDGSAVCTLVIKRNPLCDTFEAISTQNQPTKIRSKSFANIKKVPAPILIADLAQSEILKGSYFGRISTATGHDNDTGYDPYRALPRTANLLPNETSKNIFGSIQDYLKAPQSPSIASITGNISQSLSPVLNNARQGLEQASKSMKKIGENIMGIATQSDGNELNLMAVGLHLQS